MAWCANVHPQSRHNICVHDQSACRYEPQGWKFGGVAGAQGESRNYPLHATANGYALSRPVAAHLAYSADMLAVRPCQISSRMICCAGETCSFGLTSLRAPYRPFSNTPWRTRLYTPSRRWRHN